MEKGKEGAERNEVAAGALVGLRGVSHRNREINFLCDKYGLAAYMCQMWWVFGRVKSAHVRMRRGKDGGKANVWCL